MRFSKLSLGQIKQTNILLFLFLCALLVRVIGINYGYWFGDERIDSAAKALSGDLIPGQHFYPPFLHYITAVSFAVLYVVGRLFVSWYDLAGFQAQYFADPTPFYITARFLIVCISALIAPLFYLIAKECGLNKKYSFIVGLFGVVIPGMVLLSHISKGDVPLSVCTILMLFLVLKKINTPKSFKLDVLIALSIALALSFKQSYIFILIPFFSLYLLVSYFNYKDLPELLKSTFISIVLTIIFWSVFNIGILLDFSNFLSFQKIQAVMSIRDERNVLEGVFAGWGILSNPFMGVNLAILIIFLLSPIVLLKKSLLCNNKIKLILCFWFAIVVGALVVMYISGARQQSGLWVPYMVGIQLIAALTICFLFQHIQGRSLAVLRIAGLCCLSFSSYGVFIVDKQAIKKPIVIELESFLRSRYDTSNTKILSSFNLKAPQTVEMMVDEYSRHERIARKYSVEMPVRARENTVYEAKNNAINYMNMPITMHGLENTDDTSLDGNIKPYAWPLQVEEWQLEYWVNKNYKVFVLADHEYALNKSTVNLIKRFHQKIKSECLLIKTFLPTKPLYHEFSATVYECGK